MKTQKSVKKASKPHVVMDQILKNQFKKVQSNVLAASPEELQAYRDFVRPSDHFNASLTMIEAAAKKGSAQMLEFLFDQGFDAQGKARSIWNSWSNRTTPRQKDDNGNFYTPDPESGRLLDILIDHGVGVSELKGKCWGPAHIVISTYFTDEDKSVSALVKMKDAGFGMDDVDEIGERPIAVACWMLNMESLRFLIQEGASLTEKTRGGNSLLGFLLRSYGGDRPINKYERLEEIKEASDLLHQSGYDFLSEMDEKERLKKGEWSRHPSSFEEIWGHIMSNGQRKQLDATTSMPNAHRRSNRL